MDAASEIRVAPKTDEETTKAPAQGREGKDGVIRRREDGSGGEDRCSDGDGR